MKLEQWVKEGHEQLRAFFEWWGKQAKKNPEAFPTELSAGDWNEQYESFCSIELGKEEGERDDGDEEA